MRFQNVSTRLVPCAAALIFILVISTGLAQAKDNKPSPLFKESLRETLKEFDDGTETIGKKTAECQKQVEIEKEFKNGSLEITKKTIGPQGHVKIIKVEVDRNREHDGELMDKMKHIIKAGCPAHPTLVGSTCRGVKCNGFPTLVGSTCSVTCGTRSTCSNGRFCRNNPSPCAQVDGLDRLAKGNEKPFTFSIF